MCAFSPHTKQCSTTPAGHLQFTAILTLTRISADSTDEGLRATSLPPPTSDADHKSQVVSCALNQGSNNPPPQVQSFAITHRTQGSIYLHSLVYHLIKAMRKYTDEEVHRVRPRRVPSPEASISVDMGCTILTVCGGHRPVNYRNPIFLRFLWRRRHIAMINY